MLFTSLHGGSNKVETNPALVFLLQIVINKIPAFVFLYFIFIFLISLCFFILARAETG